MISLFTITALLRSPTVQSPEHLTLTHRPYTMSGEPVLFFPPSARQHHGAAAPVGNQTPPSGGRVLAKHSSPALAPACPRPLPSTCGMGSSLQPDPPSSPSHARLRPCAGNDLHQDLRIIKLHRLGCKAGGHPHLLRARPGFSHLSPAPCRLPESRDALQLLLGCFRLLIQHGRARDKAFSRALHANTPGRAPKAFGTGMQAGRQQTAPSPLWETPVLHNNGPTAGTQTPQQSWPRIVLHISVLLVKRQPRQGDSRGSTTPIAAHGSTHAPLPSATFGFFPFHDITFPLMLQQRYLCHGFTRDESAVRGTGQTLTQSEARDELAHTELQGFLAPKEELEHDARLATRPLGVCL